MAVISHDPEDKSPLGLYYNAHFSDRTDCTPLDEAYKASLRKFQIISVSSEASVYKVCHHLNEVFDLRSKNIKTLDGLAIESYLDAHANHKFNVIQIRELAANGILSDIHSKWVVIPKMTSEWNPKLAFLFFNTLREHGAIGLIFHAEGNNNLAKTLVTETPLSVTQFPATVYDEKSLITDDEF